MNLIEGNDFVNLISSIKSLATPLQDGIFTIPLLNNIPKLVARIFALWTCKNAQSYFKMKEMIA